jgi:uncharacterized membrane protein (UPF0127 family)
MQARDDIHKAGRSGISRLFAAVVLGLLPWACAPGDDSASERGSPLLAERAPTARIGPPAGYAWVIFGADTVVAEVAATAEERSEGLMYRDEVPDGTGMLFVFSDNAVRSFWMANTYVPLDIAYLDPSFRVVDIIQMEPLVTESYVSSAPAMYGLEVRQGWFADQEIGVGAQADIVFGVQRR